VAGHLSYGWHLQVAAQDAAGVQALAFLLQFTFCFFGALYFLQLGLLAMTLYVVAISL
jgi:hypothetical protein